MNYLKFIGAGVLIIAILLTLLYFINSLTHLVSKPGVTINANSASVIKELKALNRLETASFTIEKIIEGGVEEGNIFQDVLYGDRILLIAHGEVIAGFDLSGISDKDIDVTGSTLRLILPAPQILTATLSNEKTRVYDRRQGLLSRGNKDLESQARLAAEGAIRSAACEGKILEEASANAKKQLESLYKAFGYTTVIIEIPVGQCS